MSVGVVVKPGRHIQIMLETMRKFQRGVTLLIRGAESRIVEDGSKLRGRIHFLAMLESPLQGKVMVIQRAKKTGGLVGIQIVGNALVLGRRIELLEKEALLAGAVVIGP